MSLASRAAAHGDRELVVWSATGEVTTYSEMYELGCGWAGLLAARGVSKGDRVALLMSNHASFLGAYFGAQFLGAVVVPLNTELRGETLRHPLTLFHPTAVVLDDDLLPVYDEVAARLQVAPAAILAGTRLDEVPPATPLALENRDPCLIMSTSGTTGPSKGSVWTYGTVRQWAETYGRHLDYSPDDRIYCCTPLFHANSLIAGVMTAVENGCSVVLAERFSVRNFWREVAETRSTSANLIGSMIALLLGDTSLPTTAHRMAGSLTKMLASSCSAAMYVQVGASWGLAPVTAYGLTDFGTLTISTHGVEAPPGTCGRAAEGFELKLVDAREEEVADGTAGELLVRTTRPWIAPLEYFGMPEQTLASRRNLWFHTGDLLRRDEAGWFYFAGRLKDSMRRRGENVSAYEVETVALTFEVIAEAAAYAVPSEHGEDEIAVAVVLRPGDILDHNGFFEHVARELPYFAVPRYVRVVAELPKTPTQKVQKSALVAEGLTMDMLDRVALGHELIRNR